MKAKRELAYAKINMTLEVVKKRSDGYHELRSIFMPLAFSDIIDVRIQEGSRNIRLLSSHPRLNTPHNLMYVAADLFLNQYNLRYDVEIEYIKRIPSRAGLGGGSADAAAVLRALIALSEISMTNDEIIALCKQIGADVPFCYFNQPAFVSGIGENLVFFENKVDTNIVLIKPKRGASTKRIFSKMCLTEKNHLNYSRMMQDALMTNDEVAMQKALFNSLETPAFQLVPEIGELKTDLQNRGFSATIMSGSGSTIVCFVNDNHQAREMVEVYRNRGYFATITKFLKEDL